jgi:hypothetical protein
MKKDAGILIKIASNLYISMAILTILVLVYHKHRIAFHLFVSASFYFINSLFFRVFSLVILLLNYFMFLKAILNGSFFYLFFCEVGRSCLLHLERGSCYVAQDGLKFTILLPSSPKC